MINQENLLIIDEDNYNYMVRKDHQGYSLSLGYRIPRKSTKGFVGNKYYHEEIRIEDKYLAQMQFDTWKKQWESEYLKKNIIGLYINSYPIIRYYVTCPICNNDAEILTFMCMAEYGEGTRNSESHTIVCEHCCENKQDYLFNQVGICYKILFKDEEEQNFRLEYATNNIKWEDWINERNRNIN